MRVLVFDLGGGTFDVTICRHREQRDQRRRHRGDHILGGKDWDDASSTTSPRSSSRSTGSTRSRTSSSYHDLRQKCVSAKISLTKRPKVNIFHDFKPRCCASRSPARPSRS
jgi:molecular chaperone DnaK